jgi:hypothetical protein
MSAHVQPPLAVNSKSERKVNSLPPLAFVLVIIGMLAHLSNHSTKSHPIGTPVFFLHMYKNNGDFLSHKYKPVFILQIQISVDKSITIGVLSYKYKSVLINQLQLGFYLTNTNQC